MRIIQNKAAGSEGIRAQTQRFVRASGIWGALRCAAGHGCATQSISRCLGGESNSLPRTTLLLSTVLRLIGIGFLVVTIFGVVAFENQLLARGPAINKGFNIPLSLLERFAAALSSVAIYERLAKRAHSHKCHTVSLAFLDAVGEVHQKRVSARLN